MKNHTQAQRPPECAAVASLLPLLDPPLLAAHDEERVRAHLVICARCRRDVAAYDGAVVALRAYADPAAAPTVPLTREDILQLITSAAPATSTHSRTPLRLLPQIQRRARGGLRRVLGGLPAVAAVLLLVGLAAVLFDARGLLPWSFGSIGGDRGQLLSPDVELRAVSMVSADEGWAVGSVFNERDLTSRPLMLQYTHGRWMEVAVPANLDSHTSLASVSMLSADEGWVVGAVPPPAAGGQSQGILLHYSGGRWQVVSHAVAGDLARVRMRTATDGWIIGQGYGDSVLLHYNGDTWTPVNVPSLAGLGFTDIAPVAADDVWLAARDPLAASVLLHYDGRAWSRVPLPLGNAALSSLAMLNASEGWAVGGYCGCGSASGVSTTPATSTPVGPGTPIPPLRLPTQGPGGSGTGPRGALILHYHNGVWNEVTSPAQAKAEDYLFDIALVSDGEGWAVGFGGVLMSERGGRWLRVQGSWTKGLLSVGLSSATEGWAVGDQGGLLHLHDGVWNPYGEGVLRQTPASSTPLPTPTTSR
jgi:photosystem II stability/assembly factor-like uncharacterized protein